MINTPLAWGDSIWTEPNARSEIAVAAIGVAHISDAVGKANGVEMATYILPKPRLHPFIR